ncbi:MAG: cadherin-like beta sandwich domain-containing protein [Treponema sp.]
MKSLQKLVCMIFLLSIVAAGCKQSISSPSPDDSTDGKVEFSLKDKNGKDVTLSENGSEFSAKVKTSSATLFVKAGAKDDVKIAGKAVRTHSFEFDANGQEKTVNVSVVQSGTTKNYTVKVKYYSGALKKLTVKDDNSKEVHVAGMGLEYIASVGTKKATVSVETFDSSDKVKIDGTETKSATVTFEGTETKKELKVSIIHKDAEEKYSVKIYYSDPSQLPVDPELKNIKITNSANASQEFILDPKFNKINTNYTLTIPAAVDKIKVDAEADEGISIEGNGEQTFTAGETKAIKVSALSTANPSIKKEYTITVTRAAAGASANANLEKLELTPAWAGISKGWVSAPAAFDKTVTSYTGTADARNTEFLITAKPEEAGAKMTVSVGSSIITLASDTKTKINPFNFGENTYVITVTAPDGVTKKEYTIKITRAEGSYHLVSFTGSGLNDFFASYLTDYKTQGFGTKTMTATAFKDVTKTTIKAVAEIPETTQIKIKYKKNGAEVTEDLNGSKEIDLTESVTRIQLILTSKVLTDTSGNTYTLDITKSNASGNSDSSLKALDVSYYGGAAYYKIKLGQTWSPATKEYPLYIMASVKELKVDALPNDSKAKIEGWQGSTTMLFNLPVPNNKIDITVFAENGDKTTYTLNITQAKPVELKLEGQPPSIDVSTLPDGKYEVKGTYSDPEGLISEIWVGSSGLPIQESLGKKWKKAVKNTDGTFTAIIEDLKDMPNGKRDIKAGAFGTHGGAVAIARSEVFIKGSSVPAGSVKVTIDPKTYMLPGEGKISVVICDAEWWSKGEDVVYGVKEADLSGLHFPTDIQLSGITANDRKCMVLVYVYDNMKSLVYYGAARDITPHPNSVTSCTVEIKKAQ